jgi:transporter family protein
MIYLILISIIGWGLWGTFEKIALRWLNPIQILLINSVIGILSVFLYQFFFKNVEYKFEWRGIFWAILASLCATAASFGYLFALQQREASYVVSITSAYPLITFIIGIIILGETFTLYRAIGAVMVVAGVILLSR